MAQYTGEYAGQADQDGRELNVEAPLLRVFPVGSPDGLAPAIYLADCYWAESILRPDAATNARITGLLGLSPLTAAAASPTDKATVISLPPASAQVSASIGRVLPDTSDLDLEQPMDSPYLPCSIKRTGHQPIVIPKVDNAAPLAPETSVPFQAPPIAPLFEPRWTRGILSAALATSSGDGPVDVPGLINRLAAGKAIQEIPRLPVPTLRRGVQLLLDLSESMLPYHQDLEVLQTAICDVAGQERVQVLRFSGDLLRSGTGPSFRPQPYAPPRPGTVIVLLSDLAIGRNWLDSEWVGAESWAALAELARRAECPLVAFVPYGEARWPRDVAERWPPNLERRMTVFRWDRTTTAGVVRRLVGIAHEVQP